MVAVDTVPADIPSVDTVPADIPSVDIVPADIPLSGMQAADTCPVAFPPVPYQTFLESLQSLPYISNVTCVDGATFI